jgi:hypothetical protein
MWYWREGNIKQHLPATRCEGVNDTEFVTLASKRELCDEGLRFLELNTELYFRHK